MQEGENPFQTCLSQPCRLHCTAQDRAAQRARGPRLLDCTLTSVPGWLHALPLCASTLPQYTVTQPSGGLCKSPAFSSKLGKIKVCWGQLASSKRGMQLPCASHGSCGEVVNVGTPPRRGRCLWGRSDAVRSSTQPLSTRPGAMQTWEHFLPLQHLPAHTVSGLTHQEPVGCPN